jgi:hypothetical protein
MKVLGFFKKMVPNPPIARNGREYVSKFNLKPINETIQPVIVVPRFAPRIIPIPLLSPMIPALAKDITSKVTIVLL